MYILTRRMGESIIIDACVRVTVMEIRGNQVRFCIYAPYSVAVNREEIFDSKRARGEHFRALANASLRSYTTLVLTRRLHECLVIGADEVIITPTLVKRRKAEIGVDAPRSMSVYREEELVRILLGGDGKTVEQAALEFVRSLYASPPDETDDGDEDPDTDDSPSPAW